jgi:hypothetical protein
MPVTIGEWPTRLASVSTWILKSPRSFGLAQPRRESVRERSWRGQFMPLISVRSLRRSAVAVSSTRTPLCSSCVRSCAWHGRSALTLRDPRRRGRQRPGLRCSRTFAELVARDRARRGYRRSHRSRDVADAARRARGRSAPTTSAPYLSLDEAEHLIAGLAGQSALTQDAPLPHPSVCRDPKDDYLVALTLKAEADVLVTGDRDLLEMEDPPVTVVTPRQLADRLRATSNPG